MGNIEDSKKINIPLEKQTSQPIRKKTQRTAPFRSQIVKNLHSTILKCKVEFHKFPALQLGSSNNQADDDDPLPEQWSVRQQKWRQDKEKKENMNELGARKGCRSEEMVGQGSQYIQKSMMDELIEAQTCHGRIGVNWMSFVKTRKKNYLQEYAFIKELGKGAFGSVAKVKLKYGNLFRAVKLIKETPSLKQENNRKKVLAEISIPIQLDHPNIAKLFEVFQSRNSLALIMELCEGGDLFSFIKANRIFTESSAADLLKQIMSAVNYMHKKGVMHRDLKPQNMLYDNESKLLKIIDFGTAEHYKKGEKFSDLVGTPYYIAPQVLAGHYDEKCDIWSVGIILYIILSGGPPFTGKTEKEIMDKIKVQPVQFTSPIWAKRSAVSKELILNMLRRDPSTRFTAEQVLNSPWVEKVPTGVTDPDLGKQIISNLKNFHFQNKLKAVVYTYIASQLYSNKDKDILMKAFKEIDKDGDGVIERDELIKTFSDSSTNLHPQEVQRILDMIDTNGSGRIDFTEFLVAASNEEQLLKKKQLQSAFSYLDSDHSGYITFEEVQAFLDGTEQTNQQIRQIFKEVDDNGDGRISKNQFIALLLEKK